MLPSLEYSVSGTNTPLSYTWDGVTYALVINVATDSGGLPTSTADDIRALIEADLYLSDRFRVSDKTGNDGSGIVDVLAHTHFQYV